MKVIVFGATGMIGQGVLRECLLAPDVEAVLTVGRTPTGQRHAKLREIAHADLSDLTPIADDISGYDACFFCLGVSSVGMNEADYRRITYDYTLAAARPLAADNSDLTFVFVSGAGTGSGNAMWSRVKKQAEDDVLALPFRAYMFRPGFIQPLHGITSRTRLYRALYVVLKPLTPLMRRLFRSQFTTTEAVGLAMLNAARGRATKRVLASPDINELASAHAV
ncbi:NAD-dependent epimerase/dehydratase family protein [Micromonospora sp. CPCC 205371]|nr:NAD-dependent epimerase/dehydratase family protein [Micromonospora sp. CPCC 205371]